VARCFESKLSKIFNSIDIDEFSAEVMLIFSSLPALSLLGSSCLAGMQCLLLRIISINNGIDDSSFFLLHIVQQLLWWCLTFGINKKEPTKDTYNFFLSQLRIWIDQAFGMLVNKWWVFKRPLELSLANDIQLIEACFQLHNSSINQGDSKAWEISKRDPELYSPAYEEYLTNPPLDSLGSSWSRHNNV